MSYMPRMKKDYFERIIPKLKGDRNVFEVPRLMKVVVNAGAGKLATADVKNLDYIVSSLAAITGQHPVKTKARKAIAGFKLREGQPIGIMVTLRGDRMYEFIDRLIATALPRIRDFRGLSATAFQQGTYNLGIDDHTVFPEISFESGRNPFGFQISIVTSARTPEQTKELLTEFGFPFKKIKEVTSV